ncbi:MAG: hypothetical protein AABW93_00635 [Nanoarchaeota archaeon]
MDIATKIVLFNSLLSKVKEGGFSSVVEGIGDDNEVSGEVAESIVVSFLENVLIQLDNGDDFNESEEEEISFDTDEV